jgi:glycosyltransferase involved in cell wall biosynthesis
MDICVIVCTYNREDSLRTALRSLCVQNTGGLFTFEIIVVDDGSTDGTEAVVTSAATNAVVAIRFLRNVGKGQARATNLAIEATEARWVALFDDDQVADAQWLAELFAATRNTGAACVGSRRLLTFSDGRIRHLSNTCRQLLGEHVCSHDSVLYPTDLYPQGGSALIERRVFTAVGQFKEDLEFGGYDTDLFRAARAAGFVDSYAHNAVVHHVIPPYRATSAYFKWASLRMGANFARMDRRFLGLTRTAFNMALRIAQALFINLPALIWACLKGNETEALDRRCLLWRAEAYARQTAKFLLPQALTQQAFFSALEFRRERTSALAQQE